MVNFILLNTGLQKAKLHTSGMSTPVSNISTDIAILGKSSFWKSFLISSALESSEIITLANLPLSFDLK